MVGTGGECGERIRIVGCAREGRVGSWDGAEQFLDIALGGNERGCEATTDGLTLGRESCMFHVRMRIFMNFGRGFGGGGGGTGDGSEGWAGGVGWVLWGDGKRAWRRARTFVPARGGHVSD